MQLSSTIHTHNKWTHGYKEIHILVIVFYTKYRIQIWIYCTLFFSFFLSLHFSSLEYLTWLNLLNFRKPILTPFSFIFRSVTESNIATLGTKNRNVFYLQHLVLRFQQDFYDSNLDNHVKSCSQLYVWVENKRYKMSLKVSWFVFCLTLVIALLSISIALS